MKERYLRDIATYRFSKWFHHIGTLRVVQKKSNGKLMLVINDKGFGRDYATITDSHALDVFIWLGRYLALKGKLPRHLALDSIAVASQRVSKDIRKVIATEVYESTAPAPEINEP